MSTILWMISGLIVERVQVASVRVGRGSRTMNCESRKHNVQTIRELLTIRTRPPIVSGTASHCTATRRYGTRSGHLWDIFTYTGRRSRW